MLQSTDRYVATLDVKLHRVEKRLSLALVVRCGAFTRADKNVVAVPTLHLNAAVMQTMNMQFGNGGLGDRAVFLRVKYLHAVIAHVEVAFAVLAYCFFIGVSGHARFRGLGQPGKRDHKEADEEQASKQVAHGDLQCCGDRRPRAGDG